MPNSFPKDRFDSLPRHIDRVGAHRTPGRKGRGWVAFWWALAATVVLIALGVFGLFVLNDRLSFDLPGAPDTTAPTATPAPPAPTDAPAAPPEAEPTVDPSLSVTVLNGTAGIGVARGVSEELASAGWTVDGVGDANGTDFPTTTVYYAEASLEGAARGVAASLPGAVILLSSDYVDSGAALTVIVGNDYEPAEG